MGLTNQLGAYSPSIASKAEPLRVLLSSRNQFLWQPEHTKAFNEVKKLLVEPPILHVFDPRAETILEADASRDGLGFCLRQRDPLCEHCTAGKCSTCGVESKPAVEEDPKRPWRLIQCGSRFLTDAESRYAVIELESLAATWATRKCRLYLYGLPHYSLITDHKPLVSQFNGYYLQQIENPRVLNNRLKLLDYQFTTVWRAGKNPGPHAIPDALSRMPVDDPAEEDRAEDAADTVVVNAIIADSAQNVCPDLQVEKLRTCARRDKEYQNLIQALRARSDDSDSVPTGWNRRVFEELSLSDGLVMRGSQMVVPREARKEVLLSLHASH